VSERYDVPPERLGRWLERWAAAHDPVERTELRGSSQQRFARRREGQARVALEAAADVAARVLLEHRRDLDAVVLGGDRRALGEVLEDPRLRPLRPLVAERVLDVPDPRLTVLQRTPDMFRATVLRPRA
jgi:hypothetical protein